MGAKSKEKEAKEYLLQVKKLDANIESLVEQVSHLETLSTKITSTLKQDMAFGGGNQDKIGDAVAKIADLKTDINRKIDRYVEKKSEICSVIEKVENGDQAALLHKRYMLFEPWEQIALEMHCTYRNVCYIHGRALQAVVNVLESNGYVFGEKVEENEVGIQAGS